MFVYEFQKYPENFEFQLSIILHEFAREIFFFLKSNLLFKNFYCLFFSWRFNNFTLEQLWMRVFQCLLFVLKRSHIYYYVTNCMTVTLGSLLTLAWNNYFEDYILYRSCNSELIRSSCFQKESQILTKTGTKIHGLPASKYFWMRFPSIKLKISVTFW